MPTLNGRLGTQIRRSPEIDAQSQNGANKSSHGAVERSAEMGRTWTAGRWAGQLKRIGPSLGLTAQTMRRARRVDPMLCHCNGPFGCYPRATVPFPSGVTCAHNTNLESVVCGILPRLGKWYPPRTGGVSRGQHVGVAALKAEWVTYCVVHSEPDASLLHASAMQRPLESARSGAGVMHRPLTGAWLYVYGVDRGLHRNLPTV